MNHQQEPFYSFPTGMEFVPGAKTFGKKISVFAPQNEQLRIGFDRNEYTTFTVNSTGQLNIANGDSSGKITLTPGTGGVTIGASSFITCTTYVYDDLSFRTGASITGTNISIQASGAGANVSASTVQPLGGATNINTKIYSVGASATLGASIDGYCKLLIGDTAGITGAAGTATTLFSQVGIKIGTFTAGAAGATNTATLYVEGASSTTVTGQNYAIWSDAGLNRFDGTLVLGTTVSSAGTLTLDSTAYVWVASGTTTTWTLPAISGKTGWAYQIKNRGSGAITLNSNAGGNDIYNTSAVSSITINAGSAIQLFNDGTYWLVA